MSANTGWVCPKCSKVYAPHVVECHACNAAASEQQKAVPNRLPEPPTWEDRPWVPPSTPYFWSRPTFPVPPWEVTCTTCDARPYQARPYHTSGYMQVIQ